MTTDLARPVPAGVSGAAFRAGMSRLAAGVTVVASGAGGDRTTWRGLTATAVCSLTAEPPSLVVGVNHAGGTYRQAVRRGAFSVNVLAARHAALAAAFAGGSPAAGPRRFAAAGWRTGALGVPVLDDALARVECRLVQCVPFGTHALLIGAIEAVECGDGDPLVHHRCRFHDLGPEIGAHLHEGMS